MIWLAIISTDFYRQMIGHLLADKPDLRAAAGFYALYLFGTFYFAVRPALKSGKSLSAALSGALFGLVAYATYDLTNMATLKDWPFMVVAVDMTWGTFLTGVSAYASAAVSMRITGPGRG
jgi:uncharacterized membrane protein